MPSQISDGVILTGALRWTSAAVWIGLAGALVAIPSASASKCSQASEGSVHAVYITCVPEIEFESIIVLPKGPCTVPPPGRCDAPETVEPVKPEPIRVFLGVDCSKPFTISLPDDVLTECEMPTEGKLP